MDLKMIIMAAHILIHGCEGAQQVTICVGNLKMGGRCPSLAGYALPAISRTRWLTALNLRRNLVKMCLSFLGVQVTEKSELVCVIVADPHTTAIQQ